MTPRSTWLVLLAGYLSAGPGMAQAPAWPQWRGPRGDGISTETGFLTRFEEGGPKKLWEAKVGRGFASPVIRDGRLYLFSTDARSLQGETLRCLDAETGKELWQHGYEIQSVKRALNPAGGTPALCGDFVFSYGAALTLVCLEASSGKVVWTKDLMKELPGQPVPYGFQLSPLPFESLIILPALVRTGAKPAAGRVTEPRGGPYPTTGGVLLALDQASGKEVWRNTEGASAWSSPVLASIEGKPTLVHLTGRHLLGIDPARGLTRWKVDLRSVGIEGEDMAASPVIHNDIVVAPIHKAFGSTSAGTAGAAAFRIRDGKPTLLWKNTQWCHWFQSAAIWNGCVYAFDERSTFWCLDLETGKEKWRSKDLGATGKGGGGFMIADGKVLTIDLRQTLRIAEVSAAGPKVLASAVVLAPEPGYECETAPLLLDGRLYCRNHTQMVCFDLRPKRP